MGSTIKHSKPIEISVLERHDKLFNRDSQWARNKARFRQSVKEIKFEEICQHRMTSKKELSHQNSR